MTDLNVLAKQWLAAKQSEQEANKARLSIEEQIVAITGNKAEGSETHDAGGAKITVTGKMSRTLDIGTWQGIESQVPSNLSPVIYKPSLDLKGLRYIEENEPEIYALVSKAIAMKPAKTAVAVKEL